MHRLIPRLSLITALAALMAFSPSCERGDPRAHAVVIESPSQYIGGPSALAKTGDFLMYNDQIRVVISDARYSPGFGIFGGALLDVDLMRGHDEFGGEGNDSWGEMFPMVNFVGGNPALDTVYPDDEDGAPVYPGSVQIVADGSDGGPAIVRVEGGRDKYLHILKLLTDILNDEEKAFTVRTDYVLHPGARYVEIVTEAFVTDEIAAYNGWDATSEWHELPDTHEPIDPFAQLVNGILPPIQAEGEDLVVSGTAGDQVVSASTDFEAAGVVEGHALKAADPDGGLSEVLITGVDGDTLTLEEEIELADGGAYFRVLGDVGEGGHVFGDFLFPGAQVEFFMPDDANPLRADWNNGMGPSIGFDQYGATLAVAKSGGSTFTEPLLVDYFAALGNGVSYAYGVKEGKLSIPILSESFSVVFTHDSNFQTLMTPGKGVRFTRYLAVGEGDAASAAGVLWEQVRGGTMGRIEGHVLDGHSGEGRSGVNVVALRDPDPAATGEPSWDDLAGPVVQFETDLYRDLTADGSFGGPIPPGDYLLLAVGPGQSRSGWTRVHVEAGETIETALVLSATGHVEYDVVDARNEHIPVKLTFYGQDGAGKPDPVLGEGYLPGTIAEVVFTPDGTGEVELAPGRYEVVVSRGPEYSIDRKTVEVFAGTTTPVVAEIARVVDTTGWVSGDFHQHMEGSPDAGISTEDRILTNMAEHVEYVVASDHDYNTLMQPVVEEMGATEFLKTTVGDELTTIEQGHFNGWPLAFDPELPENGAPDWQPPSVEEEGLPHQTPAEIFDLLRAAGAYGEDLTVTQANHPRDGILGYYYQYLIDIETGEIPDEFVINYLELGNDIVLPEYYDDDYDAIEMSNGKRQDLTRTPTYAETTAFLEGRVTMYDHLSRTAEEQEALRTGETGLDPSYAGALDDWFNFLNKGGRYTATGNSDSHSKVSTEAGVVRNYVRSSTDLPDHIDEIEMTRNIIDGRLSHSWGPFIELWVDGDDALGEIGDTVSDDDGIVSVRVRVQSPTWFDVDRIEIFQNGVMVCEIESDHTCGEPADNYGLFHPNSSVVNFDGTVEIDLSEWWLKATPDEDMPADLLPMDSWFCAMAMGDSAMEPLATPLDREPLRIADVLSGAMSALRFDDMNNLLLSSIEINMGADYLVTFDIIPWALTNAIYVKADGDGEWDAPGLPGYLGAYEFE